MSLKKFAFALFAVLALGAMVANSASATATESNGFWYKGETKLAVGTKEPVTCSKGEESLIFESTVGTTNVPLKLQATGVTCPEGKVFNESSKAKATGKLKFTGVSVVEPAGCSVAGGSIETVALKSQVWMEGAADVQRLAPASGTEFAEVEIIGCAIANVYPLTGVIFGESAFPTFLKAILRRLHFSASINLSKGGSIKLGGHNASLVGNVTIGLTAGGEWTANET
jgi:hypothetical protein